MLTAAWGGSVLLGSPTAPLRIVRDSLSWMKPLSCPLLSSWDSTSTCTLICISLGAHIICTMGVNFQFDVFYKPHLLSGAAKEPFFLLNLRTAGFSWSIWGALKRLLETSGKIRPILSLLSIVSPLASAGYVYWHQLTLGLALEMFFALLLWELEMYLWYIAELCANAALQKNDVLV